MIIGFILSLVFFCIVLANKFDLIYIFVLKVFSETNTDISGALGQALSF